MIRRSRFTQLATIASATLPLGSAALAQEEQGGGPPVPEVTTSRFHWADFDADGRKDAFVVGTSSEGRLLRSLDDGTLTDVTASAGLTSAAPVRFGVWEDFDRDGRLDLFVGTLAGPSLLYRGLDGGSFEEVASLAGLIHQGMDLHAAFIDYDADGLPDLHVQVEGEELLYHNEGNAVFSTVALDLPVATPTTLAPVRKLSADEGPEVVATATANEDVKNDSTETRTPVAIPRRLPKDQPAVAPTQPVPSSQGALQIRCAQTLEDAAGGCLSASSTPTLGLLYPLSSNLHVHAATGFVGIGTTTPGARLDVAGDIEAESIDLGSTTTAMAVRGEATNGPTRGFLGVEGTDDFDAIASADWLGDELGVVGVSAGSSAADNIGVLGHSNGVGVRGESSLDPSGTYGELGVAGGVGLRAAGTTRAAEFLGAVDVATALDVTGTATVGALNVNGPVDVVSNLGIDLFETGGLRYARLDRDPSGGGEAILYDANADTAVHLDIDFSGAARLSLYGDDTFPDVRLVAGTGTSGATATLRAADGSPTVVIEGDSFGNGGNVSVRNDTGEATVDLSGDVINSGALYLYDRNGSNNFAGITLRATDSAVSGSRITLADSDSSVIVLDADSGGGNPKFTLYEGDGSRMYELVNSNLTLFNAAGVATIGYNRETGTKNAIVGTSSGRRRLFAMESPEVWFEDFGHGKLVAGQARIELDSIFLETITVDAGNPLNVFLTPTSPMASWWVEQGSDHFVVHETGGASNATFNWRVVGKRKGQAGVRLTRADDVARAETDAFAPDGPRRAVDDEERLESSTSSSFAQARPR